MLSPAEITAHLNRVWTHGAPSRDLSRAGVLVHTFDNTESQNEPWLPCPASDWCGKYDGRMSGSIINRRQPNVFTASVSAGLIFSPSIGIHCSYPFDGGTMNKFCGGNSPPGCVSGCTAKDGTGRPAWCSHDTAWTFTNAARIWDCAFRPEDLEGMLRHHLGRSNEYNEVVIDTRSWIPNLPDTLMAIFFIISPELSQGQRQNGESKARSVHEGFQRRFPQQQTPLLSLNQRVEEGAFTLVWS